MLCTDINSLYFGCLNASRMLVILTTNMVELNFQDGRHFMVTYGHFVILLLKTAYTSFYNNCHILNVMFII